MGIFSRIFQRGQDGSPTDGRQEERDSESQQALTTDASRDAEHSAHATPEPMAEADPTMPTPAFAPSGITAPIGCAT